MHSSSRSTRLIVQFLDKSGEVTACHVTGLLNKFRAVESSIDRFLTPCILVALLSPPQRGRVITSALFDPLPVCVVRLKR
ncbi:hypothetical protein Agabi119p4_1850 [Agaricus bisporus var. burnettii]|uniref:Uncharacterized protein n=1 Tax=Agaricus bisporus var. burnettii TaxID=192524 RepID=A0A8H7KJE2_AGABI|nr:hypothetical protein Agabi119p4_1850 [Agaricus bisporus var. burnettii]